MSRLLLSGILILAKLAQESEQSRKCIQSKLKLSCTSGQIGFTDSIDTFTPVCSLLASNPLTFRIIAQPFPDPASEFRVLDRTGIVLANVEDKLVIPHLYLFVHGFSFFHDECEFDVECFFQLSEQACSQVVMLIPLQIEDGLCSNTQTLSEIVSRQTKSSPMRLNMRTDMIHSASDAYQTIIWFDNGQVDEQTFILVIDVIDWERT